MYKRMGLIRYMVMTNLMLDGIVANQDACRWVFQMKYFTRTEYFINF